MLPEDSDDGENWENVKKNAKDKYPRLSKKDSPNFMQFKGKKELSNKKISSKIDFSIFFTILFLRLIQK